jgi:hypothetical protein
LFLLQSHNKLNVFFISFIAIIVKPSVQSPKILLYRSAFSYRSLHSSGNAQRHKGSKTFPTLAIAIIVSPSANFSAPLRPQVPHHVAKQQTAVTGLEIQPEICRRRKEKGQRADSTL